LSGKSRLLKGNPLNIQVWWLIGSSKYDRAVLG
jgi:hypothetical protein